MDNSPTQTSSEPAETPSGTAQRWGPLATLVWGAALAAAMAVFQTLGAVVFLRYWDVIHPDAPIARADLASHGGLLGFALLLSAVPVLGLLGLAVHLSRQRLKTYLALEWPRLKELGFGAGVLAATLVGTGIVAGLTGQNPPDFMADTYNSARAANMLPLLFFSFVLLAPLQEELVFRGFLFRGLKPAFGVWPAIMLTSALWAITHVQYPWFFVGEIFLLGIVLGWLRARYGSTILTTILHAGMNALALVEASLMATGQA